MGLGGDHKLAQRDSCRIDALAFRTYPCHCVAAVRLNHGPSQASSLRVPLKPVALQLRIALASSVRDMMFTALLNFSCACAAMQGRQDGETHRHRMPADGDTRRSAERLSSRLTAQGSAMIVVIPFERLWPCHSVSSRPSAACRSRGIFQAASLNSTSPRTLREARSVQLIHVAISRQ